MKKITNRQKPFGLHVMLDMYNCSPEVLNNPDLILNILKTMPGKLGMKILMGPYVSFAQPNGKRDPGGWSGFVMIQESHITVHTFIKRRFVTIDVYSCKEFDAQKSIEEFKRIFKTDDIEYTIETRGTKYPNEDID
ncbi:MAG TPA: S-adenosylmethionine decarboxylase [Candidatus Saccharimonadales bacterium]|nr:S-adenosylmethionine decarboxylase [Candidatus Saccharimonadales bacterium]